MKQESKVMDRQIQELKKLGFDEVDDAPPKSFVLSVFGLEGTGKTSFALTAPKPLALINFDMGIVRAKKPPKTAGILSKTIFVPPQADQASGKYDEKWAEFHGLIMDVLEKKLAKTVVLDTASAAWDLLRMKVFGKLSGVKPHHYTYPNGLWKGMIQTMKMSGVNVILIHRAGYAYETLKDAKGRVKLDNSGQPTEFKTDRVERKGQNETGFDVDVEIATYSLAENKSLKTPFGLEIIKSYNNTEAVGATLEDNLFNFQSLAETVVSGTEAEDWA